MLSLMFQSSDHCFDYTNLWLNSNTKPVLAVTLLQSLNTLTTEYQKSILGYTQKL